MNCALWLNKHKVYTAEEIADNFDIAALRGYFLGGSLIDWLRSNGGDKYAVMLEQLDENAEDLNDSISRIFTGRDCDTEPLKTDEALVLYIDSGGKAGFGSYGGSFGFPEFPSSGAYSSFGSYYSSLGYYTSFGGYGGSRYYGSYYGSRMWEWEWEWFGSSAVSSYGSYFMGSFNSLLRFGSGGIYLPSSGMFKSYGSYDFFVSEFALSSQEYDEIMYACLMHCPLNKFGYGIHLIYFSPN